MPTFLSYGATAVRDRAGRLRVFADGRDGDLYQVRQVAPNDGWSAWESLGNPGVALDSTPTAGPINLSDLIGLAVFARGADSTVHRRIQQLADGPWSAWESLGGSVHTSPATMLSTGGVNYLFACGSAGLMENSDITGGWAAHPGPAVGGMPAVGSSADGRLEVMAVTNNGDVVHQWQLTGGGWSPWFSHGHPASATVYAPAAMAPSADGRLEVFVGGADLALHHTWQTARNNGWSAWYSHGVPRPGGAVDAATLPAVAASANGRLEAFVVGWDGALYHKWQTAPNNGWSAWYSHGDPGTRLYPVPTVAPSADGRLEVFVVGRDGSLYHKRQTAPNNGWSAWQSRGHP